MLFCLGFCYVFLIAFGQNFSEIEFNRTLQFHLVEIWRFLYPPPSNSVPFLETHLDTMWFISFTC